MNRTGRLLIGSLSLAAVCLSLNAQACSVAAWSASSGAIAEGSPAPGGIARFEEICGLSVTGTGYVQDNSPTDASDTRIRLRFYVLPGAGTSDIRVLEAYADDAATTLAFTISFTNSSNSLSFTGAGGTPGAVVLAEPAKWQLVEVDWQAAGNLTYWVNADARTDTPTGSTNAGTATHVGMVRLGAPQAAGFGDWTRLTFDSYHANRTLPVGGLLVGDANGGGSINSTDATRILNEASLGGTLSIGVPDCNASGVVNSTDAVCVLNLSSL